MSSSDNSYHPQFDVDHTHPGSESVQLTLWDWLNEAAQAVEQMPELIDLNSGIMALETVMDSIANQPVLTQLAIASDASVQLSNLLERKSQEWLEEWRRGRVEAIGLSEDWAAGLVRQPVHFDLSPLVETPEPPLKPKRIRRTADSSLAAPVEMERVLELLNQLIEIPTTPETVQQQLLSLAGNETPTEWGKQIAAAMQQYCSSNVPPSSLHDCITFIRLQQATRLSITELWLGLLLNGYSLRPAAPRSGDSPEAFYQLPHTLEIDLKASFD